MKYIILMIVFLTACSSSRKEIPETIEFVSDTAVFLCDYRQITKLVDVCLLFENQKGYCDSLAKDKFCKRIQ